MKRSLFFIGLALLCATGLCAQDITGRWSGEFPGQNDQPAVKFSLTIAENTYQMDFGMDGTADIRGSYTIDGNQITIWDTAGEKICPSDQKGVYSFRVEGDVLTFTKVSDACPGRGDGPPLVVKKM